MNSKENNFVKKIKIKITNILAFINKKKNNSGKVSKVVNHRLASLKKYKFKKVKVSILAIICVVLFIISTVNVMSLLVSLMEQQQNNVYYYEDGMKFLEIENGFITEKLIVESGDVLPSISDYFSDDYEIRSDATISYFSGKNGISIESFTYEKDGVIYVRGIQELDVVIKNGKEYNTKLIVRDTTEPYVTLQDLTISEGEYVDPTSFVSLYIDNSQIQEHTAYYPDSIDFSKSGTYDLKVKVCDLSNNCVEGVSKLTIVKEASTSGPSTNNGNNKNETTSSDKNNSSKPSSGSGSSSNSGGSSSSSGSSGGSSSGNSGGSSGGGSSGSIGSNEPNEPAPPRVFVETVVESNAIYKYDDHYGARMNYYAAKVTFNVYSDGYKEVINISGATYTKYDPSGYVINFPAIKKEAINYMQNNSEAINNVTSLFLSSTNEVRSERKVGTLTLNSDLCKIAQIRAMEIAYSGKTVDSQNYHIRPDGSRFSTIFNDYGYKASLTGENFARGAIGISNYTAFESLKDSTSHYQNMIYPNYKKIGIGKFSFNGYTIWVQIFSN